MIHGKTKLKKLQLTTSMIKGLKLIIVIIKRKLYIIMET